MVYPSKYERQYDFQNYQNANPTRPLPADKVNADYNSVQGSIGEIVDFLKYSLRADGAIADGAVGFDQLDEAILTNGITTLSFWTTDTNYSVGRVVVFGVSFYLCEESHRSGVFTTDLSAGKWALLGTMPNGADGADAPTYGGTSTTSLAVASGSKSFTTQAGLAYVAGSRVRATSAGDTTRFMEGVVTSYSGTTLVINVDNIGATGTYADWNFSIAGDPGEDLSAYEAAVVQSRSWALTHDLTAFDAVYTMGRTSANGVGRGFFKNVGATALLDSGASFTDAAGNNFQYVAGAEGADITCFGALGDGSTDCTTAIRNAVIFAAGDWVYAPPASGKYVITDTVEYRTSSADPFTPGFKLRGGGYLRTVFDNQVAGTALTGVYTTTNGSVIVTMAWPSHGKIPGEAFTAFNVSATVGGLTMEGTWRITATPDANTVQFNHSSPASSTVAVATANATITKPMFSVMTTGSINDVFLAQTGVRFLDFGVQTTTSPIGSTAIRLLSAFEVDIDIHIDGMSADGIQIVSMLGDHDGSNQICIDGRIENCKRYAIVTSVASGVNEISGMVLGGKRLFIQKCGTAGGSITTSGGMKWKGQGLHFGTVFFTICENGGLYVPGGAGLANTITYDFLVFENNKVRSIQVDGLDGMTGQMLQIYNNDDFTASYGVRLDGTSSVVRNVKIPLAIVRATSGNNAYAAFSQTGVNADKSNRVGSVIWQNFDYTGQTRFDGINSGPNISEKLTGSGTFTLEVGCRWLRVRGWGGGGGGAGSGTTPGSGGAGGNTTFGTATANGGAGAVGGTGGAGGTASGGTANRTGGTGQNGSGLSATAGGNGAASSRGAVGFGGTPGGGAGAAASANSGSGGGGGGVNTTANGGGGGGAGGEFDFVIANPGLTYTYAVGAGGTAGTAGTSGAAGAAGGSGYLIIEEHFSGM